jgi:Ras family/WD domain, G-beta repeat
MKRLWRTPRHTDLVFDIALSPDGELIASVSRDGTTRISDLARGAEIAVLEETRSGGSAGCVRFSPDGEFIASMTDAVRLWRRRDWEPVATMPRSIGGVGGLDFHPSRPLIAVMDRSAGRIDCFLIDDALRSVGVKAESRRYVNAKVVLLGDTGVGKSGLGLVLSGQAYQPTDSTHGRNVWTFDSQQIDVPGSGKQTREVLLWDLAGQPGYRLIHQLHLGEVAVALIVFDSRSETEPFSGVKHWVRALAQAKRIEGDAAIPLRAYLVAARADCGGIPVTRERIDAMVAELGLDGFFETSAKEGWQVTELVGAIRGSIDWDRLPMVSSNVLFESIKRFLVEEKERGGLLATADDLFRGFQRAEPDLAGENDLQASFGACIGRVESRGLIRRLRFGDLVLLQPELLDSYASALVQAAKDEPDGLGYIGEDEALAGRFRMADSERITDKGQEKLLLIATVEELLRHEIALRETTDRGVDLIFPSQFTVQRPDAPNIAGRALVFAFEGPLANIYATLAVRLSHSSLFRRQSMWRDVATYTATDGGTCGIAMREIDEGCGELAVFYDEHASEVVRLQFEMYVFEHLQLRALPGTVVRRPVRDCPACSYVLPDELVQGRLERGRTTIRCPMCDESTISLIGGETSAGRRRPSWRWTAAPTSAVTAASPRLGSKARSRRPTSTCSCATTAPTGSG